MPAKIFIRNRRWYVLAIIATIWIGLGSRHLPLPALGFLGKYPGDFLWALLVFFCWGFIFASASTFRVALLAIGTSYGIEILKFYQAPWMVSLRHTTFGALVFGHVFSWQNLVAYTLGIATGCAIEVFAGQKFMRSKRLVSNSSQAPRKNLLRD